jgi:hypothetical protein
MGRIVPLPPELRTTLHRLFGDAVDRVEVIEHSWWTRFHGRAHATTRRRRIYLRGSAADFFDDPVLLLHEYFHVLKQWEPRELSVWRYLLEWFRRGYWDNRFEVEAREFTTDNLHRFRAWLAQDRARLAPPPDQGPGNA